MDTAGNDSSNRCGGPCQGARPARRLRAARVLAALLAASLAMAPQAAWAQLQAKWPDFIDLTTGTLERGPGFYLSWLKILPLVLWFWLWVKTTDWVNVDSQRFRLKYVLWNPVNFFPFFICFLLAFYIPYFAGGLILIALAHLIPLSLYIRYRNGEVEPHEKVLTSDHIRFLAAEWLRPLGIKIEAERKAAYEMGPPLKLVSKSGPSERDDTARLLIARQNPGFVPARELLYDAIQRRADALILDYTADSVALRYEIDGLWQNGEALDRESGDAILEVLKTMAALNPEERRARQEGKISVEIEKSKYPTSLVAQGTKTGERAVLQIAAEKSPFKTLADLGMREKLIEQFKEQLGQKKGMILISTPPRGGFTTLFNVSLESTDRFTRSFMIVEDTQKNEKAIENVPITTYDPAQSETPMSVLPRMARLYPDVIAIRDFIDADTANFLCQQVLEDRLIIGGIRAKDSVEALLRVVALKVPPATLAPALLAVINMRLIRKLCPNCREAYAPTPQMLQQLRLPAGKIEAFYRPPQEPPEEVCPDCGGIGYVGRTAIFELLVLNDTLRQAVVATPRLDVLRQEARKQGLRGLQEEGILLVAKGVTSLAELMRVLKE